MASERLLDLDGHWQKFDEIRILMGDEISHRTRKALLLSVKRRAEERLDGSIEEDKERDPFLTGIDAIVEALARNSQFLGLRKELPPLVHHRWICCSA